MTCTYRFVGTNGKQTVIKGQAAFKAFLADGGLEQLRGEAAPKFSGRQANVLDRIPALETAAQGVKEGTVTREQYSKLVNKLKPVTPYAEVPTPATVADMQRGLTSDKVERIGVPSETLKAGDPVGLRLDIPAYSNNGVWVVSIHEQAAGYSAGKSIGYESVAAVTKPTFGVVEKAALAIAGGKPKATIAVMKGDWKPITPKQASATAKMAMKNDNWVQVGMDPTRHAYFYDRENMEPVVSADEAVQIGPLVLAKNPVYGKKSDFAFSKRQELRDAADAIANMDPEVRDDTMIGDFPGAADGYMLYEARVLLKKPSEKLKRVNENNSFELWNRYDYVANVDGELFGVTKQEDPDEPDDETKFVYSFAPLDDPFKDVTTTTDQTDELFKEMRASLGAGPALSRRQTNTPEFKRFFKDSKVVDGNGEPLVVYHTGVVDTDELISGAEVQRRLGKKLIFANEGVYFTADPVYSAGYGRNREGVIMYPVYLSIQNPLVITNKKELNALEKLKRVFLSDKARKEAENAGISDRMVSMYITEQYKNELIKKGYDGIINEAYNEIVVFKPTQIKSATGNVGTFDATNPDIRFSRQQDIGAALEDRVDNDFDALVKEYNRLDGTDGGKVLDTDIARELSPEYQADRSRAGEVHEAVSKFIDKLYQERIENTSPDGVVVFMAGGGGAGKSSAGQLLADVFETADIVYDGTLSTYSKAERRIQTALDAGQDVYISYIYREPVDALRNGVLSRAMVTGRTVPLDGLVKGHAGSSEVVNRLQEKFGSDPAFKIYAIDNSKGWGNATLEPLENIPRVKMEGLKEEFENATNEEYEAGRISETVYRATVGESVAAAQADRKQDEEGVRRGRESGRQRDAVSFSKRQPRGRETEGWVLSRDEVGRFRFGAGAKAYRAVADVANNVLDRIGMKPISEELGRAMRKMKAEVERAQRLTVDVAGKMKELPEQERQMVSDVIEGELKRGVKPPERVLMLAASLQSIMSEQSAELVRLGMLSPDAAGRWDGKYLPRFYEQKLGDEVKAWGKAAKALLGRKKTMQGIGGSSLKSRGMFELVNVEDLQAWKDEGWEVRDSDFDPDTDETVMVWRDYTRRERDDMGEIRDSMFRFVMGYNKSQRDIALGRLYESLAANYASKKEKPGYVKVPDTKVQDTMARQYGKLAGMWVPAEVLDHLSAFDQTQQNELTKMYLKGLSLWKEGKTVLNPVSHANNILSNLTMAHFAGISYWDIDKYAGAVRDLIKKTPMVEEALDAGLFGGTFNRAELLNEMPPQLKALAGMSESRLKKGVDTTWNALSWFIRKPAASAYQAEDQFFRYLIYRDARQRGLGVEDAIDYSQQYIFTYDDLPKGARGLRDFALPFFAYTYKVVPPLVNTALEKPWRYAAPAAALYTVNALMYAMAASLGGGDDEDWWTVIRRYVTDPEFRDKARAMEEQERENLPPWMKGYSAMLGTPKAIRLGMDDVTNLPVFLDVSRVFPGGDLLDAHANAGGVPLLQPITPSNPVLNALGVMLWNKDSFFGKDIVDATDTSAEATAKRLKWTWQQFSPAVAVGNYHWDRALNVIANQTGQPVLGYTGISKDGLPVQPGFAAAQTVGIKIRPIDLEMSAEISESQNKRLARDLDAKIRQIKRLEDKGAITGEAADTEIEKLQQKKEFLSEGLTVEGKPKK
jgi:hypothetical protein